MISRRSFFGALAVAPLAAVKAEAEPKAVTVSVGVNVDDEGKMQAYVQETARRAVSAGIKQYDRQLSSRLSDFRQRHL